MVNAKTADTQSAVLHVHVTPKSGRDEIVGIERPQHSASDNSVPVLELRVRVTAPPDNGKANKAVCKLIASAVGIPKTAVNVASGDTSRHKRLTLACSQELVDSFLLSCQQID